MTFTTKNDENERLLGLNFILSLVRCFVSIPLIVKNIGVTMPKITGIHVGVCYSSSTLTSAAGA